MCLFVAVSTDSCLCFQLEISLQINAQFSLEIHLAQLQANQPVLWILRLCECSAVTLQGYVLCVSFSKAVLCLVKTFF